MHKKIYLLSVVLMLMMTPSMAPAQNYQSLFGSTSTSWSIILHGYCDFIVDSTLTATSDTIVDSLTYKIIDGLHGLLREDTLTGKVWIYDLTDQKEYLVMDLGLTLGSTFYIIDVLGDSIPIVSDSVYDEAGLRHVRFSEMINMCGLMEKIEFVEGSGPNADFQYMGSSFDGQVVSYMLCHIKDGTKVLGNDLFNDTCQVFEVGIVENAPCTPRFQVYPNPTPGTLNIQALQADAHLAQVQMYTSLGRLINPPCTENQLDLEGFANGLYFLILTDDQGQRASFTIVKD